MNALRRFAQRYLIADAAPLSARERAISAVAGLLGILLMQGILGVLPGSPDTAYLLAPLGASAVILFALPHSPLAQPWSLAGGLLVSAGVGVLCGHFVQPAWLAVGVALGAAIWLTALLRCIHPPGGAMAVLFALGAQQHTPQLLTAGLNVLAALMAALAVNGLLPGRRYPQCAPAGKATPPPARIGIDHADLHHALETLDTYLDISEEDLVRVYDLATRHAHGRHEQRTCGEVMARPACSVEFGSGLDEAWTLLRERHLHGLPVVDRAQRVIGVLTLDDFLRHVPADHGPLTDNLRRWLRPSPASHSDKPEVVGQIMRDRFAVATLDTPLSDIAALLAAQEHPLIVPVIDHERRLAGVLTQTDLLATLYHRQAAQAAQT